MQKDKNQGIFRRVLLTAFFFFLGGSPLLPVQPALYKSTPFIDGEALRYKVKWGFIRVANWKGISGPFTAWFSNDDAAVPLRIQMKSALGSITLELDHIERRDWADPEKRILSSGIKPGR